MFALITLWCYIVLEVSNGLYERGAVSMGTQEFALDMYDELEVAVREERPIRLTFIGKAEEQEVRRMWAEGELSL
jgi:hypothetical protein